MTNNAYWNKTSEDLFKELGSSSQGLNALQAQKRLSQHGPNRLQVKKQAGVLALFLGQFKSPIVMILIFATLVSAILKDWADAFIILLIVMGSALLSFFQEYGANNAAEKLRSQVSHKTDAQREGKIIPTPTEEIVPGDVVLLAAGSLVPADGVVLEARDFFVNQAVLTGETFPVEKMPGVVTKDAGLAKRTNVVFMGSNVSSGSARVLIVETGTHTAFGQIASSLNLRPPETEFERGVKRLGYLLSEVMFILVLGIFAFNVFFNKPVLDSLLFSVALAVGLTPQLLPAIININLAKGSQAMAQQGVIVRRLESIENFGSMDILCTDKTGTLTLGVVQLDEALDPSGRPSELVKRYAYLNARLQTGLPNPLDEAIGRQAVTGLEAYTKVDEIPYDFVRKRLSVVVRRDEDQPLILTKGALENVLAVCTHVLSEHGEETLDESALAEIQERFTQWSAQGYRVLGMAAKPVSIQEFPYTVHAEMGLTFAGFLLFFDPPKEGVQATIRELADLGVTLKIITGDNKLVAAHLGQVVGLGNVTVLTGTEIDNLHGEALWHAVEQTTIFAEVDPNQKEHIILALKKRGHVVGYMGDGINDAPSLHSADVGISVDNAVDVAKESADFVLLQHDLKVLQQGILQGRRTFANTIKYVFMATSANFGNMFSVAGASLFLPFLPMLPKQILLINFLTDLPEMTIAGDNVDSAFLEKPQRWDIAFIRRFMLIFGSISSLFDLVTFGILLWPLQASQVQFHTGWFIESVLSASLVVFALRTRIPFLRSKPSRALLTVTGLIALTTLVLPYSPLANLLGFTSLPILYLIAILAIIIAYFTTAELAKRWFFSHFNR